MNHLNGFETAILLTIILSIGVYSISGLWNYRKNLGNQTALAASIITLMWVASATFFTVA